MALAVTLLLVVAARGIALVLLAVATAVATAVAALLLLVVAAAVALLAAVASPVATATALSTKRMQTGEEARVKRITQDNCALTPADIRTSSNTESARRNKFLIIQHRCTCPP